MFKLSKLKRMQICLRIMCIIRLCAFRSVSECITNRISCDFDIAEYCESFMPHLIFTECFELVIDGCQCTRAEKTERISDWHFAQKYLNVCVPAADKGHNCSCCNKCMWTLIGGNAVSSFIMETSIMRYAEKQGLSLPSRWFAMMYFFAYRCFKKVGLIKK